MNAPDVAGSTPGPELVPGAAAAEARNRARRAAAGIEKLTDVEVPLRDGATLLADVFKPLAEGRYPVILRLGLYGRAFGAGSVCDEASRQAAEVREDAWFDPGPSETTTPMLRFAESAVSANAFDWVPQGYVCVRVDGRGVGRVPGVLDPFSATEARDYEDVIAWAAAQPWSSGAVGLFGGSYHATIQWTVASRRPPALKAMIPWSGDSDPYRELSHPGGILIRGYREDWLANLVLPCQCSPDPPRVDLVGRLADHPFDEPAHYGPDGDVLCGPDLERVTVPFLTAVNLGSAIHGRGGAEAFVRCPSPEAELVVVDANYWEFMYRDGLAQQFAFFDRHLKGDLTAPRFPRVRMILRTGHGGFEWREDTSWPPESTEVRSFYLDVGRASAPGDPGRPGGLVDSPPVAPAVAAYSAEAPADHQAPGPGAVVETAPLTEDLEVAGHVNATLWVSADAADMDLYAVLRVLDRAGHEVPYGVRPREAGLPLAFGCLRVSHRALDPERSDHRRPWHTHRPADHAPLRPDEVVLVEVEMSIVTARIPAGHRLRLEIQPFEARVGPAGRETDRPGMVAGRHYDQAVHAGATNRIHSGPDHPSHLRLPLVPRRVPAPA